MRRFLWKVLLSSCVMAALAVSASAQSIPGDAVVDNSQQSALLANVGWTQNLGHQVPLDLAFTDENGKQVKLGDYFGKKPVILTLMYFGCPMLCGEVLKGSFDGLKEMKFQAGRDYQYVAVSINPQEGPSMAAAKKASYLKKYGMTGVASGFHFLTGQEANIQALAKAVGFRYDYDPHSQSYAHPAGIMLITPDGHISRYLGGVIFHSQDLRLGLVDSSQGKVGSLTDILLLKCCSFDPNTGRYNFAVQNMLRGGGLLILLALGLLVLTLTRRNNVNRDDVSGDNVPEDDAFRK